MHVDWVRFQVNCQPPYSLVQEGGSESRPQKSSRESKCRWQGRLKATSRPSKSVELPNERRLPPNRGQGDLRFPGEGSWRMVLPKDEVEIGNSTE